MGSKQRWTVFIFLSIILGASLLLPIVINNNEALAAAPPYCDIYGFTRTLNTYDAEVINGWWASGTENWWLSGASSNRYCTCSAGWPSTPYLNSSVWTPHNYLSGNAMFIFAGHGGEHALVFEHNSAADLSYLLDRRAFSIADPQLWIQDSWCQMDNMLHAGLLSCRSTYGNSMYSSIGAYWRCAKMTDLVLGFEWDVTNQEAKAFAMFFYTYTCKQNKESGWARTAAIQATLNGCQGYIWGVGGAELWSRDWDPNNPNYSHIKLTNPRFGDPG